MRPSLGQALATQWHLVPRFVRSLGCLTRPTHHFGQSAQTEVWCTCLWGAPPGWGSTSTLCLTDVLWLVLPSLPTHSTPSRRHSHRHLDFRRAGRRRCGLRHHRMAIIEQSRWKSAFCASDTGSPPSCWPSPVPLTIEFPIPSSRMPSRSVSDWMLGGSGMRRSRAPLPRDNRPRRDDSVVECMLRVPPDQTLDSLGRREQVVNRSSIESMSYRRRARAWLPSMAH